MKAKQISGLGSAAFLNTGTGADQIVELGTGGVLPAVDGSNLQNLPSGSGGGTAKRPVVSVDLGSSSGYTIASSGIVNGTVFLFGNDTSTFKIIYLPPASSYSSGFYITICRTAGTSTYPIRVYPSASTSDTLNEGTLSYASVGDERSWTFMSDGSSRWLLIGQGQG